MGFKYWHGGYTRHRLSYHVVWVPKYRKRVLRGKVAKKIKESIYQACIVNRWWVEELNVMVDHVHMLIQIQPTLSISKVVQIIKGGTSRILRMEYHKLEEFIWGNSFWAEGYFAETVGSRNISEMKRYIKENTQEIMPQQKRNHGL